MRIRSAELLHVGPFRERLNIDSLGDGINVLAAANEAGKSTLIKAIARGLFDRHTCKDSEIKALQPVGTELSPRISVVFETKEGRYQVQKTFLNAPKCNLKEWSNQAWQAIAEGDQADVRVQQLLQSKQPGRGATTAAHWGLMSYLWARQGEATAWPDWNNDVGDLIRSRLAKVSLDPLVDSLRTALWAEYTLNFTNKGQVKKGGALQLAELEIQELETALGSVRQSLQELDERSRQYKALSSEQRILEAEAETLRSKAAALREQARKAERVQLEIQGVRAEFEAAKVALSQVHEEVLTLAKVEKDLAIAEERCAKQSAAVDSAAAKSAELRTRLARSEESVVKGKQSVKDQRAVLERQRECIAWSQLSREIESLNSLVTKTATKSEELASLKRKLAAFSALKSSHLKSIEAVERKIQDRQIQLAALGLDVVLKPDSDQTLELNRSGAIEVVNLPGNQESRVTSPQALSLAIKGWGNISIRSGASEVEAVLADVESLTTELNRLLKKCAVQNVAEARESLRLKQTLKGEFKLLKASLDALLDGFESVDEVETRLATLLERRERLSSECSKKFSNGGVTLADLEAEEALLIQNVRQTELTLEDDESSLKRDRQAMQLMTQTAAEAANGVAESSASRLHLKEQAAQLKTKYSDGLEGEKEALQQRFVEAEARFRAKEKELPEEFEKLADRNRRASAALAELEAQLLERNRQQEHLRGSLETLGSQGLYSRETQLLEKLESAKERALKTRDLGWSTRVAHDLFGFRKSEATRTVLRPLEDRLTATFAEISGDTSRRVFLGDSLEILGLGHNRDRLVSFRLLSQGAKEQLLLCLRLAVASELAEIEPQVLILDDVLVNTDRARQERVLDLLSGLGPNIQVLLLTCHADWYRGLGTFHTL